MTPLIKISQISEVAPMTTRRFVEIAQFVKDWNRDPSRRSLMVADEPLAGSLGYRTALAAIVLCLCSRDRLPVPSWVSDYRPLGEPFALSGESLEGPMGDFIRYRTPSIAAGMGVYFDRSLLESV